MSPVKVRAQKTLALHKLNLKGEEEGYWNKHVHQEKQEWMAA